MKTFLLSVVCILGWSCTSKVEHQSSTSPEKTKEEKLELFLTMADSLRKEAKVPGVGIALVVDHKVLYIGGLGHRDVENELPVTENTNFLIGSTTKAFTGTLIAKMANKGHLDWNAPIKSYLPELRLSERYIEEHLTLKDALSHTTGLARFDDLWKGTDFKRSETIEVLKEIPFIAPFRNSYNYNNWMYVLSGLVAEKVSGRSWEDLVQKELLDPLEMSDTFTTDEAFLATKERALGYQRDGQTLEKYIPLKAIAPAGSVSSTPKDLSKWLLMFVNQGKHNGQSFLDEQTFDAVVSPQNNIGFRAPDQFWYYNAGWGGYYSNGKRNLGHDGSIEGYNTWATLKPDDGFGIFVLTNQLSGFKNIVAGYAENIFLKDDYSKDLNAENELVATYAIVKIKNTLNLKGISETQSYLEKIDRTHLESSMNSLGYELMAQAKMKKAQFIFEMNTKDHPNSSNAFDSLGEFYFTTEDFEKSLMHYTRSYELDTTNSNALAMINKIKSML